MTRRIFAAVMQIGGLTVMVKLVGMGKDMLVAGQFGAGDAMDAFLIAFLLPNFATGIIAGSFISALIPTYVQVREEKGKAESDRLVANVTFLGTALLIVVSLLFAVTNRFTLPYLGASFGPQKLLLTEKLFLILIPSVVLSGFYTIYSAILNAEERFTLSSVSPALNPLVIILFLLFFFRSPSIYALAYGTVAGCVAQAAVMAWYLKRDGFPIIPRWSGFGPELRQVIHQYFPMVAASFLMSGSIMVDQGMAGMLGSGSVSLLNYGSKVVILLLSVGSTAISTAILPYFSTMGLRMTGEEMKRTLKRYVRFILILTLPATLLVVFFSGFLVRVLFQRGAFTAQDTHSVAMVLACFALEIPFYMAGAVLIQFLSSMKMNKAILWMAGIDFIANVTLNYLFMIRMGVAGIALSSAVVAALAFFFLAAVSGRQFSAQPAGIS